MIVNVFAFFGGRRSEMLASKNDDSWGTGCAGLFSYTSGEKIIETVSARPPQGALLHLHFE
jgi:hypothetical protein